MVFGYNDNLYHMLTGTKKGQRIRESVDIEFITHPLMMMIMSITIEEKEGILKHMGSKEMKNMMTHLMMMVMMMNRTATNTSMKEICRENLEITGEVQKNKVAI